MESKKSASYILCLLLFAYFQNCLVSQPDCPDDGGSFYKTGIESKSFEIACSSGTRITMLASCHCGWKKGGKCYGKKEADPRRFQKEDRRWNWECSNDYVFSSFEEKAILSQIGVDSKFETRQCPENMAVTRIWSTTYSQERNDRDFNIECGVLVGRTIIDKCSELPKRAEKYLDGRHGTPVEDKWQEHIPEGYVLTGIATKHSNAKEDRSFQLTVCRHCQTPFWTRWTIFSECAACDSGATRFVAIRTRTCQHDKDKVKLSSKCLCEDGKEDEEQRACICRKSAPTTQNVHEQEDLINSGNITLNETGIEEVEKEVTDQEEEVVTEALDLNVTGQVLGGGIGSKELKKGDGGGPFIDLSSPRIIFCIIIICVAAMMIVGTLGYVAYYTFGQGGSTAPIGKAKKKKEDDESDEEEIDA